MVSVAARPGRLLMLLLVSSSFESIPAFAPSVGRLPFEPRTRGAAPPSGAASVVCVFAQPRGTQPCKTKVIVPVTSAEDPRPYGQRIYPVHPDDLSPEARRQGLMRMILAVGVRDLVMGLVLALAIVASSAGFDAPDYHFPSTMWLFSCIFARMVTQDMGPVAFDMRHSASGFQARAHEAKAPKMSRGDSFAQWRDSTVNGNAASQAPAGAGAVEGLVAAARKRPRPVLNKGTQRLVVNFASAVAEEPPRSRPQGLNLLVTLVWGFLADLLGSARWLVSRRPGAEEEEPELWDPRDDSTPPESGV